MDNCKHSLVVCIDCTKNNQSNLNDLLLTYLSAPPPVDSFSSSAYVVDDDVQVRPFRLDTKYYTVDLGLCKLSSPTVGTERFADRVEAVMFHLENSSSFQQENDAKFWLKTLDSWLIYIKHWEPAVCLLIFDRVPAEMKSSVITWCVKNEFELIELNPDEETLQEIEDCEEVYGIRRIVQVLKAHSWSDLDLKDESVENEERNKRLRELLGEDEEDDNGTTVSLLNTVPGVVCNDDTVAMATVLENKLKLKQESNASCIDYENHSKNVDSMLKVDEEHDGVAMATASAEGEGASFEELFAKFAAFKATAETMPENQRKQYAEKVTLAFWRAIGGDDDEIGGLNEESDDEGAGI